MSEVVASTAEDLRSAHLLFLAVTLLRCPTVEILSRYSFSSACRVLLIQLNIANISSSSGGVNLKIFLLENSFRSMFRPVGDVYLTTTSQAHLHQGQIAIVLQGRKTNFISYSDRAITQSIKERIKDGT